MNITVYNDTINSPNYGCQLVSHSIRKVFNDLFPHDNIEYISMGKLSKPSNPPDLVWVNGEGSFGTHKNNIPGGFGLLKFIIDSFYKKAPIYLSNVTIQLSHHNLSKILPLLKKCTLITLREPISYNFLKDNTDLTNLRLFPDIGCYYFKDENIPNKDIDIVVGFGSLSKELSYNDQKVKDYINIFNELSNEGYIIYLLDFPNNPSSDLNFLKPHISGNIKVISKDFKEYFNIVKRSKLNVTGRHHGAVMSFIGKTPFYTFEANMWKTEGDQLLYGPYDKFIFKNLNKDFLKKNIIQNYNKYKNYSFILNDKFNKLYPLFDGHIRVIKDNKLNLNHL